ncbi:MAG: hypothetical protein KTR14_02105 [Vampirovibrio sp.]|nr:hypothetical protein [Vampirovibrio sp.]
MNIQLYQLLIQQMDEPPSLEKVQQPSALPEDWPVVLKHIDTFRGQIQHFTVTDGKADLHCTSKVPELLERIRSMELESIIHLAGGEPYYSEKHNAYVVDVQWVHTLKEYDGVVQQRKEAEAQRLSQLKEEGFFEEYADLEYTPPQKQMTDPTTTND